MKMKKKQFRIGELAKRLNVERFVIRFWEKEFNLRSHRSTGGQRFYEEKDLNKFLCIKELLYKRGFTINGARQQLKKVKDDSIVLGSHRTTIDQQEDQVKHDDELSEQIKVLREKMLQLRERL